MVGLIRKGFGLVQCSFHSFSLFLFSSPHPLYLSFEALNKELLFFSRLKYSRLAQCIDKVLELIGGLFVSFRKKPFLPEMAFDWSVIFFSFFSAYLFYELAHSRCRARGVPSIIRHCPFPIQSPIQDDSHALMPKHTFVISLEML